MRRVSCLVMPVASAMCRRLSSTDAPAASSAVLAPSSQRLAPGPYRKVGNVFIVRCHDHPFKHFWEVNKELRDLRLEFKGQTSIVPDTPMFRQKLWRVRHIVGIDMLDLDEVRELIGVPSHIKFKELVSQLPKNFQQTKGMKGPLLRSKMNFMQLRQQRLRDILQRDQVELRLLEKKKLLRAKQAQLAAA